MGSIFRHVIRKVQLILVLVNPCSFIMHRYHPPLPCFKSHSRSAELPMSGFDKTHIVIDIGISSTKLAQAKIRGNKSR